MSFLGDLVGFFTGPSIGGSIARTVLLGYISKKLEKSIERDSPTGSVGSVGVPGTVTPPVDPGVRLQLNPNTENIIPVVYGVSTLGGNITDAYLSTDKSKMYTVFTICEQTGTMLDGSASIINFKKIYLNNMEVKLKADGLTVDYVVDGDGVQVTDARDLIQIYCYSGNSLTPVSPAGYTAASAPTAMDLIPGWTSNHRMDNLVFAVVITTYNKEKNITNIGQYRFELENTMKKPGDVLYDYLHNTRYGAGLSDSGIYIQ